MNKNFDAWYDGFCDGEFTYKEITEIFGFINELKIKDEDEQRFCTMFKASLKLAFEAGGK